MKLGLLAGTGDLPRAVIGGAREQGFDVFVAQIEGDFDLEADGETYDFGSFGKIIRDFKSNNVTHVCFAGNVARPDFRDIRPDLKTLARLPGAIMAARKGDDALLSYVVETFEKEGFSIVSPQELCASILMPPGNVGNHKMTNEDKDDAQKAMKIALEIGRLDIGQSAIVCKGLVLAVEAQEGTDAMLNRVAELPMTVRGDTSGRAGVLAKMVKPGQETRVDLPTIGPETIRLADAAGLAGIITEAGKAFILNKAETTEMANQAGIFIVGLPPVDT